MMAEFIFIFSFAVFISFMLIPIFYKLGHKFNLLDYPDRKRKIHKKEVPFTGGLAIYLSFFLASFLIMALKPEIYSNINSKFIGIFLSSTFILLLGLIDDIRDMSARLKIFLQIIIVCIPFFFGLDIRSFHIPFLGKIEFGYFYIFITFFWYLGFINSMNLIDGLDGLAGGIALISSFVLIVFSFLYSNPLMGFFSSVLLGCTLSFVYFNFISRKVFLGDNGSTLLGFLLASIVVLGSKAAPSSPDPKIIILFCMTIPIIDTFLSIVRRITKGLHIFTSDKEHIHHKLMNIGVSSKNTVFLLWMISVFSGIIGLVVVSK